MGRHCRTMKRIENKGRNNQKGSSSCPFTLDRITMSHNQTMFKHLSSSSSRLTSNSNSRSEWRLKKAVHALYAEKKFATAILLAMLLVLLL